MTRRMLSILLVLTMVFSVVPLAVFAQDYPSLPFDEEFLVELEPNSSVWYQFVPEETQRYRFESFNENGVDPFCAVYDSEMNKIAEVDDYNNANFQGTVELTAGETYYFEFYEFDKNDSGSYTVKVCALTPSEIWLSEYWYEAYVGCKLELTAEYYPSDAYAPMTWTSSDNNVATVDENGHVEIVGAGDATITVSTLGGIMDTCQISAKSSEPIAVGDIDTVIFDGLLETREVIAAYRFTPEETAYYRMYSYDLISTTEVAVDPRLWLRDQYMNEVGYNDDGGEDVNADLQSKLEAGKTYLFLVEPYDCKAVGEIKVTLTRCPPVESIKIDCGDLVVEQGQYIDFYDTQYPVGCGIEEVTYTTSDENVVRLDGQTGYAVGAGEATITVRNESGHTDSITVTVLPITTLLENTTQTLNCNASEGSAQEKYQFVPEESGVYRFESFNIIGDWDPRITLSDTYNTLRYNGNIGDDPNFLLVYQLVAGKPYYLEIEVDSIDQSSDGSVDFKVTKVDESEFPVLEPNSSTDVIVDIAALNKYFIFIPSVGGMYSIFSTHEEGGIDTKLEVFDANWEMCYSNDDGGGDSNYLLEEEFEAGSIYYIKSFLYSCDEIGTHIINIDLLSASAVQSTTVEDAEIMGDEIKALGTTFTLDGIDVVDSPVLCLLGNSGYELYRELSFDDDGNVSYDFSSADFADGVNTKTFAFGVCVDGKWYYSNQFTVSYAISFSVTFDANGGIGTMEGADVISGGEYILPENSFTAPAGMRFKAWSIDGVEKAVGDVVEIVADTTVIAVWEDIIGDINGDYKISSIDYFLLKRSCFNLYDLSEAQERRADINNDGTVNASDYMLLKCI